MSSILVIGSSNTDMVIRVSRLPLPGQTVLGKSFETFAGGKGANQAIAARRAGASVRFLAAVGKDGYGQDAVEGFDAAGIDTSLIRMIDDVASGVAMIVVSDDGENSIAVAPGANSRLAPDMLGDPARLFADTSLVLLQLETPLETVGAAIDHAHRLGVRCVLNPAPAAAIPDEVLTKLFCITPNESEAAGLTGIGVVDQDSARRAAEHLRLKGVENVVITMGENGALLHNADETFHQVASRVKAVDTTAAGDTFNGVLAAMIAEGRSIRDAVRIAVAAATRSVQMTGAIASIPYRADFM